MAGSGQQRMLSKQEQEALRRKMGEALVWLRPAGDGEYITLGAYTPWERASEVPGHALEEVAEWLGWEARLRRTWGDEKYYATATVAGKHRLVKAAMALMDEQLAAAGRDPGQSMCLLEYMKLLKKAMMAAPSAAAPEPEPPPAPKRTPKKKSPPKRRRAAPKAKPFVPPTVEEVAEYCKEKGLNVDPGRFWDHFESVGWVVGKTGKKMQVWKSAVNQWSRNDEEYQKEREKKSGNGMVNAKPVAPGRDVLAQAGGYVSLKEKAG